eukprot:2815461-Pleurochrysis_carterae.AAC.2
MYWWRIKIVSIKAIWVPLRRLAAIPRRVRQDPPSEEIAPFRKEKLVIGNIANETYRLVAARAGNGTDSGHLQIT